MKFVSGLLALAALASAVPGNTPTPIDVHLEKAGNSQVKAVITNTGKTNLRLLKVGTILDKAVVEKTKVTTATGKKVGFEGIHIYVATGSLDENAFQSIRAGQSIDVTFDVAEAHDLSASGKYGIQTSGAFSYAAEGSTQLIGSISYDSNKLELDVNGLVAATVRVAYHKRRTEIQDDCTGSQLQMAEDALTQCTRVARLAQKAAVDGPAAKLIEYFKSASPEVRRTVSNVYAMVAAECSSPTRGFSTYHCTDVYRNCGSGNVLAYAIPSLDIMAYCPLYFTMPATTRSCHGQDRATTVIHEATHLQQIKGTLDYGGYGYDFVRRLKGQDNLNHADTYSLFANAISVGC